jgi:hypothetical protein
MDGFVDDTAHHLAEPCRPSRQQAIPRIDWGNRLIKEGSTMVPCMQQAVSSNYRSVSTTPLGIRLRREARLATPEEINIQISLRQSGRSRRRHYSDVASTSHRTLGVRENPSEILHEHLDSKGKENVTLDLSATIPRRGMDDLPKHLLPSMATAIRH